MDTLLHIHPRRRTFFRRDGNCLIFRWIGIIIMALKTGLIYGYEEKGFDY